MFALLLIEIEVKARFFPIVLLSVLLGLARPMVYSLPIAAIFAWPIANYVKKQKNASIKIFANCSAALALILGPVLVFVGSGFYFREYLGDFFASQKAHDIWGRKFGLHWQLISAPQSVGGSGQVLFWDLIGFYLPIVLTMFFFSLLFLKRSHLFARFESAIATPSFWLCLLISVAHSAMAFLSYPIFASTARHVFGIPCIFYCLLLILKSVKLPRWVTGSLYFTCVVFFVRWWARFAKGSWIG